MSERVLAGRQHRFLSGRRWVAAIAVLVACGPAAACGSNDPDDGAGATGHPTLTLVTYDSFVLDDTVKALVESKLGIRLKVVQRGDAAAALSTAVLTAGKPEGDVFFGVDNTLLSRALAADVFVESKVEVPDSVVASLRLDSTGRLVPIDTAPVCINYDRDWFDEHDLAPPTSMDSLADPAYRGLLAIESPVTSSPGLVFLLGVASALGADADAFWASLAANDVAVAGSWDDAWNAMYTVNGGDRPLVLSYASSPPAEVFYSEGALSEPRSGVIESTCITQVEFAGVLRGSSHPALAARLVQEMLGADWQAALPLTNFVFPARSDAAIPEEFSSFATVPANPIRLDPATVASIRDRLVDRWRTVME